MNNNDILIRLRYALDIKDTDMVEIFGLGGFNTTKENLQKMLTKLKSTETETDEFGENKYVEECDNNMLDSFLDGFIIFKRGRQNSKSAEPQKQNLNDRSVNNILLKKVKIALSLTSEDILDILDDVDVNLSKSELSAVLRKEGHRNYKECGDRYARNFLKGLALRYRAS
ncbi:DUF1456 family protein [Paraliobacillus sediminis]|uniref:DUF1456 family protein n=1 Tax=Paraliobacillus sediminis TaxID=1885916 RepID=UPI000E3C60ED|nr:DUF1456 family protein [Paraliobacillus sediminis]